MPRRFDIAGIIVIVVAVLTYASVRSEFRLRPHMPVEFFDAATVPATRRAAEQKVAEAYWACAVTQIQWQYGYAHRLPETPPDYFLVSARVGSDANDPNVRLRYWRKLRDVWGISTVWENRYEWSSISLKETFQSAGHWLEEQMRKLIG